MIYQISRDGDTSSECSECKKQHEEGESHSGHHHQTSSDEDEQEIINLPTQNAQIKSHGRQSAHFSLIMDEVRQLKLKNQEQERQIRQLRYELEGRRSKEFLQSQFSKSAKEIPRFKKQGTISPKGIGRVFSPEMKMHKNVQGETILHITLLQKQIKDLQLRCLQLTNKVSQYDQNFNWMQRFIQSFVHMAEQLSVNYGGKLQLRGQTLRKKTKASWKYIKGLINYLIK